MSHRSERSPRRRDTPPRPQPTQHPTRAAARRSKRARPDEENAGSRRLRPFDSLVGEAEWATLVPIVERIGADAKTVLPRLAAYVAAILDWNRRVSNLISRNDEARLVSRHLTESLEPGKAMAESGAERWIDLGSGAGFPALPIAIAGIGKKWLLVESRRPKTLFLRRVIRDLGLDYVQVAHSRLEELLDRAEAGAPDPELLKAGGLPFDAFTSRAVIPFGPTLELSARCLRHGGSAFLWKGSGRDEEKASSPDWAERWTEQPDIILESTPIVVCNMLLNK